MDELTGLAERQLDRVKVLLNQLDLRFADLHNKLFGAGVAIGFGQTDYIVLSIMGGGMEGSLLMTSGILNDINRDRLPALDACNSFNKSNSSHTVFLHDAEAGWALIVQQTLPVEVLLDAPQFFDALVRHLPSVAAEYRTTLSENWAIGGRPWQWNNEDLDALLIRSML